MRNTNVFTVALAASLLVAAGCGSPNQTIDAAAENVEEAAGDAANSLGAAVDELGDMAEDAAEEVGKAIDSRGREKSNAK